MDDAFFRAEPAQLRFGREAAPEPGEIGSDVVEPPAHHEVLQRADRRDAELVAPADRERQTVPFNPCAGLQDDVGRGVVRIRVHGIGAGRGPRGGKSEIEGFQGGES